MTGSEKLESYLVGETEENREEIIERIAIKMEAENITEREALIQFFGENRGRKK